MSMDRYNEGIEAAQALIRGSSKHLKDDFLEGFIETLSREHRTNQQLTYETMFRCILEAAERHSEKCYDARNEWSLFICHKVMTHLNEMEDNLFPFPYI